MITGSLIYGLNQKMVQVRLNSVDATPFTFGTYFPVTKVTGFIWQNLTNQLGHKNVAADLQSDNATVLRKRRPLFETVKGDIPFLSISREMKRSEIKAYQTALALAGNADATELVQYWGNDVDFCFNGVNAELEYIAWALASNAGQLSFTTTNNATFANEFDLDYDVDGDENDIPLKQKTGTNWSEAGDADILGDLRTIIKSAKARGLNPKYLFVNLDQFYEIASAEQIIKACASYLSNAVGMAQTPDLETVNQMLAKTAWLNKIQIIVIDQTVTREFADGTTSSANPFQDHRAILAEKQILGSTQYDQLQENDPNVIIARRSHVTVKKYSTVEPKSEITIGEADAVPVLDTAYRNMYIKTDAKDWNESDTDTSKETEE